jgi:hypothetical protein
LPLQEPETVAGAVDQDVPLLSASDVGASALKVALSALTLIIVAANAVPAEKTKASTPEVTYFLKFFISLTLYIHATIRTSECNPEDIQPKNCHNSLILLTYFG